MPPPPQAETKSSPPRPGWAMRLCEPTCICTGRSCWNLLRRPWPAPNARRPRRRAQPHPGRSGGNKLCLPPGSGSKSSTSTREGSDSRPPKTRKFQAGAKIVAGLRSRVPSSHTLQPQHSMHPHTSLPTWVKLCGGTGGLRLRPSLTLPLWTLGQEGSFTLRLLECLDWAGRSF